MLSILDGKERKILPKHNLKRNDDDDEEKKKKEKKYVRQYIGTKFSSYVLYICIYLSPFFFLSYIIKACSLMFNIPYRHHTQFVTSGSRSMYQKLFRVR